MNKTDKELVSGMLLDDEQSIRQFFFEECKPIFQYIIRKVFNYQVEEEEFISEFYLYLKENNWHALRQFEFRSGLKTWISSVAIPFFAKKRAELMINESSEHLITEQITEDYDVFLEENIANLLSGLKIDRYCFVIQALVLEDRDPQEVAAEMGITAENLRQIKCRALQKLKEIIEKEVEYAKKNQKYIILKMNTIQIKHKKNNIFFCYKCHILPKK